MTMKERRTDLARPLLVWWGQYGRKNLPWQHDRNPYRVWVSEIMLQQTQVQTVIPYFERFMATFPDIASLAAASEDAVMHQWTGLGYYARGRNLHKAARQIVAEHDGSMPGDFDAIVALPGIGRSTAGAIASFCFNQRAPILDGNVKRVLARYYRVDGWPGENAVAKVLWDLAEQNTPEKRVADYTQAIMDLGATVCVRSRPLCTQCPLRAKCAVAGSDVLVNYPGKKPKKTLPEKRAKALVIGDADGRLLLVKRPPTGVWGGLWSFAECDVDADEVAWFRSEYGMDLATGTPWPPVTHTFSHYRLLLTPVPATLMSGVEGVAENAGCDWYDPREPNERGLAAPVRRLLKSKSHPI